MGYSGVITHLLSFDPRICIPARPQLFTCAERWTTTTIAAEDIESILEKWIGPRCNFKRINGVGPVGFICFGKGIPKNLTSFWNHTNSCGKLLEDKIGVTYFFNTETSIKCYPSFSFGGVFSLEWRLCPRLSERCLFWDPTHLRSFGTNQPQPTKCQPTKPDVNLNQRKKTTNPNLAGWWLNQPLWKILVKLEIFPK